MIIYGEPLAHALHWVPHWACRSEHP